jgi:hypothetical protein
MKMLSWYKSWFCTNGSLSIGAYAKHVGAAFGFFFGFFLLSLCIFALALYIEIALHAPAWVGWVPVLIHLPLGVLAIVSWIGILAASTIRFVRHLMAGRAEQETFASVK